MDGKRLGAPKGNRNSMRHGLRAGRLPAGCCGIRRSIDELRRTLEDACIDAHGGISVVEAATIQTALKWHTHGMLSQRWLRLHCNEMTFAERLTYSREVAQASTNRDRAISTLSICRRKELADVLYGAPINVSEPEADPSDSDATASTPERDGGTGG